MKGSDSHSVIIMMGSNAGDRRANLDRAVTALRCYVTVDAVTTDLDNPDITGEGADYLNRLVFGRTSLTVSELNAMLKELESRLGRDRDTPTEVIIDIDTVVYAGTVVKKKEYESAPFRSLINP